MGVLSITQAVAADSITADSSKTSSTSAALAAPSLPTLREDAGMHSNTATETATAIDTAYNDSMPDSDNQDDMSVQAVKAGFLPLALQKAHLSSQSIDENLGNRSESTRSLNAGFHTPWSSVTDLQSMGHRYDTHNSLSNLQQQHHTNTAHSDAAYDNDNCSHDDNSGYHHSRRYSYRGADNWAPTVENVSLSLCGHLISETSVLDAETAHEAFVSNSITWQEFCINPEVRAVMLTCQPFNAHILCTQTIIWPQCLCNACLYCFMISQCMQGYISNENLLVLIGEQLYTLQQALPHILSIAAFGRALPANNTVYTASSSTDNLAADNYSSDNADNTQDAAITTTAPTADSNNTYSDTPESKQQQLGSNGANGVTRSGSVDHAQDEADNSSIPPKPSTPVVSLTTDVTASPALSWSGWLVDRISYSNNSTKAASDTSNSSKSLERKRSKSKMSTAVRQIRTLRPTSEQLQVSLNHTSDIEASSCLHLKYS
jgi:hypothetical protein